MLVCFFSLIFMKYICFGKLQLMLCISWCLFDFEFHGTIIEITASILGKSELDETVHCQSNKIWTINIQKWRLLIWCESILLTGGGSLLNPDSYRVFHKYMRHMSLKVSTDLLKLRLHVFWFVFLGKPRAADGVSSCVDLTALPHGSNHILTTTFNVFVGC